MPMPYRDESHDRRRALRLFPSLLAALCLSSSALPAIAQEDDLVQLRALDGSAVVKGKLVEVRDDSYVLDTDLGMLQIDIEEADCVGAACPTTLAEFDNAFSILSSVGDVETLIQPLVLSYAQSMDAGYEIKETVNGAREISIVSEKDDRLLADITLRTANNSVIRQAAAGNAVPAGPPEIRVFSDPGLRSAPPDENDALLAFEGIAIIVHPDNPISIMNKEAIAALFACDQTEWEDLGGPAGSVRLYAREDRSNAFELFRRSILEPYGAELCPSAVRVDSNAELADMVAAAPEGIGFISLDEDHGAKPVGIQECSVLAYRPSPFSIKAEDYPLAQRIMVSEPRKDSSKAARKFLDFAFGERGQDRLREIGFVDLTVDNTDSLKGNYRQAWIETAAKTAQRASRVEELTDTTWNARRLSTTLRFRASANDLNEKNALDNHALRDLRRLANYLRSDVGEDAEVLVLGFADTSGGYEENLALSEQRAQSVARKLTSLGITPTTVAGFGEEAPVACNDHLAGRSKNRRVEVWLRS